MKKLFATIMALVIIQFGYSQSNILETIYLKNGSIIKGMIVEIVPNVSYTVKTADGSIFFCSIGDITKITREVIGSKTPVDTAKTNGKNLKKGYEGIVEFGYGAKSGKYGLDVAKLNVINGYRINKMLFVGGGIGLRMFTQNGSSMIPVFADVRASFTEKSVSPYASFSAGMAFNTSYGFKDAGFLFNPEIGIQFNKNKDFLFHISIGYDMQQMKFPVIHADGLNSYITNVIRFSESANINIGITF